MPTSGDVVDLELGTPEGREAGFRHPAVLVTAQRILDTGPSVVHVVPLRRRSAGSTRRSSSSRTGPTVSMTSPRPSANTSVPSPLAVLAVRGNVGAATLAQLRETITVILDLP